MDRKKATRSLHLLLKPELRRRLERSAEYVGASVSELVREAIRHKCETIEERRRTHGRHP